MRNLLQRGGETPEEWEREVGSLGCLPFAVLGMPGNLGTVTRTLFLLLLAPGWVRTALQQLCLGTAASCFDVCEGFGPRDSSRLPPAPEFPREVGQGDVNVLGNLDNGLSSRPRGCPV